MKTRTENISTLANSASEISMDNYSIVNTTASDDTLGQKTNRSKLHKSATVNASESSLRKSVSDTSKIQLHKSASANTNESPLRKSGKNSDKDNERDLTRKTSLPENAVNKISNLSNSQDAIRIDLKNGSQVIYDGTDAVFFPKKSSKPNVMRVFNPAYKTGVFQLSKSNSNSNSPSNSNNNSPRPTAKEIRDRINPWENWDWAESEDELKSELKSECEIKPAKNNTITTTNTTSTTSTTCTSTATETAGLSYSCRK